MAGILRAGELVHIESLSELKRQHRIKARLLAPLPEIPESLAHDLTIRTEGERLLIETPGDLSAFLKWLADAPLDDIHVQPVGLRAIYDRFHHRGGAGKTEPQPEVAV